ncbi:general secretion pathway protein C [Natronospira proteinivora]|uniref:General secretion pathway protein C n=1 Tax=Natronospira proteinivora TaxID=1807133 RepID=A0ABT1G8R3_9GAMM|nr:type II secretion system protein GspC [Natronospira proteinivora]MCP1726723.1 general secretion pathway protein C [Natronospira proteinivora]
MAFRLANIAQWRNPDQEQLQRLGRRLPVFVSLLLVIAIAYALADTTWKLIPLNDEAADAAPPAQSPANANGEGRGVADLDQLLAQSVFGDPDPEDDPTQELDLAEVDAPETQLNLELRGVLATEIPEMARAIIASDTDDDESYSVGDSIGSGASVRAIYRDRVILERGGELETLRLPRDDDEGLTLSQRANGDGGDQDDREVTVPDEVADLRSAIQEDPERITDVIRPTPHHVDGEMVGFRIFPGSMREAFQAMDLRAGDIVTAVDGQNLDSPAAGMQLMNDLQDASSVELTIQRGGREIQVTISLD